jgi:CheY-like chemotaxis protein
MLNGDAHHSSVKVRIELRISRCRVVKDRNARNIPQMSLTILHVEDHPTVADAVKDTLEAEGWRVVTCADGAAALNRLAGSIPYDLLITDNHLPHANGLEIVRYARALPHRKHIPVIMFTASDRRGEAQTAGVNAYLRKPEDLGKLIETVTGLTGRGGSSRP